MFAATQFSIDTDVDVEMQNVATAAAAPPETPPEGASTTDESSPDIAELLKTTGIDTMFGGAAPSANGTANATAPQNGAMDEFVHRVMEIFAADNVVDKIKEGRQFLYDKAIDYSTSLSKIESDITAVYADTTIPEAEASAKVFALGKKKQWILPRIEPLRKAVAMHDIYESALKAYFAKKSGGLVSIVQKINPEVLILVCIVIFEGWSLYQLVATLQPIKAELDANIRYEQERIAAEQKAQQPQPAPQSTTVSQSTNNNGEAIQTPQAATAN
jgi:hypothetical protein